MSEQLLFQRTEGIKYPKILFILNARGIPSILELTLISGYESGCRNIV